MLLFFVFVCLYYVQTPFNKVALYMALPVCVCVYVCVCVCVCVQHVKRVLPLLRQGDNDEPDRANEPLAVLDIEAEEPEP